MKRWIAVLAIMATGLLTSRFAGAQANVVHCEGVSDYSLLFGGSHQFDVFGAQHVSDFATRLANQNYPNKLTWISRGHLWMNNDVYNTDFMDTDRSNSLTHISPSTIVGADYAFFDYPQNGVAYFSGHGYSPGSTFTTKCPRNPVTNTCPCHHPTDCSTDWSEVCFMTPDAYIDPAHYVGTCFARWSPEILTSSTHDQGDSVQNHVVIYSSTYQQMAFGESPGSGAFGGAGTNGGANVVFFSSSYGSDPWFWFANEISQFAGMHLFGTYQSVSGDHAAAAEDGNLFGYMVQQNPRGRVEDAWLDMMGLMTSGSNCTPTPSTCCKGGYYGCGSNHISSFALDQTTAKSRVQTETWVTAQVQDSQDLTGNTPGEWQAYRCNYDCNLYPKVALQ